VAPGVDLNAAALASFARTQLTAPEATLDTERAGVYSGKEVYLRSVELNIPDADIEVAELHALFFAPDIDGRTTRDLFQLVGTVDKPRALAFLKVFLELVNSFEFD
jgi:hypothetical protein